MTHALDPERLVHAVALAEDLSLRELDRLSGNAESIASRVVAGSSVRIELATARGWAATLGASLDWLSGLGGQQPDAEHVRQAVLESRRRYAAEHPPRGRRGAGKRVLSLLTKNRQNGRSGSGSA